MARTAADVLLHLVRLRIVQAVAGPGLPEAGWPSRDSVACATERVYALAEGAASSRPPTWRPPRP